jgi:hypothetical protein
MDSSRHRLLGIYLNDHLGGSTAGIEMARRSRDANRGTEFSNPLASVCGEIEADRDALESIMDDLDIGRSRIKPVLAWMAEKAGRLKLNGQLHGYSPLSRVVELESLVLGITGKLRLWQLLSELVDRETTADLGVLAARAERQRTQVEDLQRRAALLL